MKSIPSIKILSILQNNTKTLKNCIIILYYNRVYLINIDWLNTVEEALLLKKSWSQELCHKDNIKIYCDVVLENDCNSDMNISNPENFKKLLTENKINPFSYGFFGVAVHYSFSLLFLSLIPGNQWIFVCS